jgi:Ca-activated chloride channel family protein
MTLDPNDPRLTAYVLGELDPSEVGMVEHLLTESDEARRIVDEIRLTVGWLARELRHEQETYLQQQSLNHQPVAKSIKSLAPPAKPWWRRHAYKLGSLAALLLLTVGGVTRVAIAPRSEPEAAPAPIAAHLPDGIAGEVGASAPMLAEDAPASPAGAPARVDMLAVSVAAHRGHARAALGLAPDAGGASVASASRLLRRKSVVQGSSGIELALLATNGNKQRTFGFPAAATEGQYFKLNAQEPAPTQLKASQFRRLDHAKGGMGGGAGMMSGRALQQQLGRSASGPHVAQAVDPARDLGAGLTDARSQAAAPRGAVADGVGSAVVRGGRPDAAKLGSKPVTAGASATRLAKEVSPAKAAAPLDKFSNAPELEQLAESVPRSKVKSALGDAPQQLEPLADGPYRPAREAPQSTFLIDLDRTSYATIRRSLDQNKLPPKDEVCIEELLNEFPYHDAAPLRTDPDPLALHVEIAGCPWDQRHRLARVAIAARPVDQANLPSCNLVFLIDVSRSMQQPDRLALIQWSLSRLIGQLRTRDRIAIVTFGETPGVVLSPTSGLSKAKIRASVEDLRVEAPDTTRSGLALAYQVANQNFLEQGTNRVILVTDASSKIGAMGQDDFIGLAAAKASSGVSLSVLGVGNGTVDDQTMATLAEKGRGHHAFIRSPLQAYRMLVEEMGSKLATVATEGRAVVEVNPERVSAYRLLGYDGATAPAAGSIDDSRDSGAIVEGHHITALYEIVPSTDLNIARQLAEPSRKRDGQRPETLTVRLSYKRPDESQSRLIERAAIDRQTSFEGASDDLKLGAAVAGFGMLLRESPFPGSCSYDLVHEIIRPFAAARYDRSGYFREFAGLIDKAKALSTGPR